MNFLKTTAYGNNIQTMTDDMVCINWSAYLLVYKRPFYFLVWCWKNRSTRKLRQKPQKGNLMYPTVSCKRQFQLHNDLLIIDKFLFLFDINSKSAC